jgi:isoquinoline 1-oxidoreductase
MRHDEQADMMASMECSNEPGTFDRRQFLKTLGGGIFILFTVGQVDAQAAAGFGGGRGYPQDFNAYLRIGEDGRVTCFSGKVELGQGVVTSLAMMLAEELEVPLESVDMVMGDTAQCPPDMGTFGSMSTRFFGPAVRAAGAEARGVLLDLAAERLGAPRDQLVASAGVISVKDQSQKKVTYAELAQGKTIEKHLQTKPALKTPAEFKVMGKPVTRRDAVEKVTGKAQYAGDVRLEGMLYAAILRPPAHGAKMKSVDTAEAEKAEGAQVVRDGDLIAVLHKTPDGARKAFDKIKAEWDAPPAQCDDKTIFDYLMKTPPNGNVSARGGDVAEGEKLAAVKFEETYYNSYVAHAAIETHTALADVQADKATVWASTQGPFGIPGSVAPAVRIAPDKIRVYTPFVGGGFGGKTAAPQAVEAARLSKLVGKPVQVCWTRAEEFFFDTFRPASIIKIRSGITNAGEIAFWDYIVYYAGQRGSEHIYNIAHHRTAVHGEWGRGAGGGHPFSVGAWRAPANNSNTHARESQIDIMAAKAGIDPVEFRLKNLKDDRMIRVLKAAAEKFGWTAAKAPSGRGFGVACGIDAGTYVATLAEVAVDKATGKVQVKRVVAAQDMGTVVNPEGATIQMEGCITMGLGYALSEEVHFQGSRILDEDFSAYVLPRFSWLPKIETVLIKADDLTPQGGGEPAIVTMGGVVANAIFDATGARLHNMPMTPERVKQALAAHA